ncbi:FtsQ-type POTRA domain-containing protein [Microbacterium rhizomatis]|uniref:FtsQ-type POTRA domain-containing protein n=1 Tax=Microbacterium rhizomatis TaxID=1631477 RepID=A0A5J5J806_9MICO|nr:FtsQ-type POTRA domain-containing protein [Microbacterium rhizomatis]KAA9110923.1 FtsQ-type POTRA domain-containing protein [Microbacterium rhizomatis]
MRRPSPLPLPEPSRAAEPAAAADAVSIDEGAPPRGPQNAPGTQRRDPPGQSGTTAIETAGVLTALRPSALPVAAGDTVRADTTAPREAEPPLGLRDVWRAARARRKALRAEVRRFTGRQRRRRAVWIGSAAAVVVLILATLGAAYSPLFAVEEIRVVGTSQLDPQAVENALSSQLGTPLPRVDQSAVKAALVGFPLVETYTLEARPPHELIVRIVERTPVGVVSGRAGFSVVDAAGVALSTSAAMPAGLPLLTITGGTESPAFAAAGLVLRALPDAVRAQVTAVTASSPDDVTLTLGTNTQIVWGNADQSALKALVLETTMRARPPASVSVYDVSSPQAIVVR